MTKTFLFRPAVLIPLGITIVIVGLCLCVWFLWFSNPSVAFEVPGPGHLDFDYPVAGHYSLIRPSAYETMVVPDGGWDEKTPIIPPSVVEIAWNERFVIAKQRLVRMGEKYQFWILDTTEPKVFGPFEAPAFKEKKKELGISDSLELKDVYEYKNRTNNFGGN